jgi:rhodanese-related sulfurtransferase
MGNSRICVSLENASPHTHEDTHQLNGSAIPERNVMPIEDNPDPATLYCACPKCVNGAARVLQRRGLSPSEIAVLLGLGEHAVEQLLSEGETSASDRGR